MLLLTHSATRFLAVGSFLVAIVAASPCRAAGPTHATAKSKAGPTENVEVRITTLRKQLHITPEQEPAWNTFAQAMRDNAARMDDLRKKKLDETKTMTAVDQLNAYASVVDAHADGVHKLISPFQAVYDTLSDEQKKTADRIFRERARAAAQRHRP